MKHYILAVYITPENREYLSYLKVMDKDMRFKNFINMLIEQYSNQDEDWQKTKLTIKTEKHGK